MSCAKWGCTTAAGWRAEYVAASPASGPVLTGSLLSCRAHLDEVRAAVRPYAVAPVEPCGGCTTRDARIGLLDLLAGGERTECEPSDPWADVIGPVRPPSAPAGGSTRARP